MDVNVFVGCVKVTSVKNGTASCHISRDCFCEDIGSLDCTGMVHNHDSQHPFIIAKDLLSALFKKFAAMASADQAKYLGDNQYLQVLNGFKNSYFKVIHFFLLQHNDSN